METKNLFVDFLKLNDLANYRLAKGYYLETLEHGEKRVVVHSGSKEQFICLNKDVAKIVATLLPSRNYNVKMMPLLVDEKGKAVLK